MRTTEDVICLQFARACLSGLISQLDAISLGARKHIVAFHIIVCAVVGINTVRAQAPPATPFPVPGTFPSTLDLNGREANAFIGDIAAENVLKDPPPLNYEPYLFTTLAGNAGYGSADGYGSAARFNAPFGVAVDGAGNVYVADSYNSTIRKITSAGVVSTVAGLAGGEGSADGPGSAARFDQPEGVAADSAGNVYVADSYNNTIRKITSAGVVSTLAGLAGAPGSADGAGSDARFYHPSGVALDSAGNIYVADHFNATIRKITSGGVVSTLAGLAGNSGSVDGIGSAARFDQPDGVAVDSAGNVYVADFGSHTIRKITPAGLVTTLAGLAYNFGSADGAGGSVARFDHPYGVAADSAGNVYVGDSYNETIRKITPAGVVSTLAGMAGSYGDADGTGSDARFARPAGVAVDSAGNIDVADAYNNTIRKITSAGVVSTLAGLATSSFGSTDGPGSAARFGSPEGVAVDDAGNVYVADSYNYTIRKITRAGVVTTLAGLAGSYGSVDSTGSSARFNTPFSVAVDSAGNVYVADTGNSTIRKITSGGVVSSFAGLAGSFGSADGTGSAARFNDPIGVAVDNALNVYVADFSNNTIRKITPARVVSTLAGLAGPPGSADGAGSDARFNGPNGVAVDSGGNVYVADAYNHTIRKITPGGFVSTFAGLAGSYGSADGTGSAARFYYPSDVAVDGQGNVYVADSNHTIRKITSAGVVSTLAGIAGYTGSADGTGNAARFYYPAGVAVDSVGDLYVADAVNNTIRVGGAIPMYLSGVVSRKTHASIIEPFDILLPLLPFTGPRGIECRSKDAATGYTMIFTFANTLTSVGSVSAMATSPSGPQPVSSSGAIGADSHEYIVDLAGVPNAQYVTVTLSNVHDAAKNVGDVSQQMGVLIGDTTANGVVDSVDISHVKSQSGRIVRSSNFRADVVSDGSISSSDTSLVKSKAGMTLPSAP